MRQSLILTTRKLCESQSHNIVKQVVQGMDKAVAVVVAIAVVAIICGCAGNAFAFLCCKCPRVQRNCDFALR